MSGSLLVNIYTCLYFFVDLAISLSVCLSACLCLFVCLGSVYLSVCLPICLPWQSVCSSFCWPVCLSVCLCVCLSSVFFTVCLCVCLSVHLSFFVIIFLVCPRSSCSPVCPSVELTKIVHFWRRCVLLLMPFVSLTQSQPVGPLIRFYHLCYIQTEVNKPLYFQARASASCVHVEWSCQIQICFMQLVHSNFRVLGIVHVLWCCTDEKKVLSSFLKCAGFPNNCEVTAC